MTGRHRAPGRAARARRWLLTEPGRPAAVRDSPRAPWLAVAAVCAGSFMGQLDASIVTLAFPTLQHAFGAPLAGVQWVGQAYLLVLISLLGAAGRGADTLGRKLVYSYGFVIFAAGSALCGLAPTLPALVGARVFQGAGAAMLQANSAAIISAAVPGDRLGRAIGMQGAAQALGLAVGPAAGGLLIGLGGWRLIFFVNVPVGLAGALAARSFLPPSLHLAARRPFDWAGLALFLPATAALLLAISAALLLAIAAAAALLLAAFARRERRAAAPMLDPWLLRHTRAGACAASGLLCYLVLSGILTVAPFYLEIAGGAPPSRAGLQLLVVPAGAGLAAPVAGRLADRAGPRLLTAGGLTATAAMLALSASARIQPAVFLASLAVAGAGLGAFVTPNNAALMRAAPRQQAGMAGGIINLTRGLGTAVGLAVAGLAYTAGAHRGPATAAGAASGYAGTARLLAVIAVAAALIAGVRRHARPAGTRFARRAGGGSGAARGRAAWKNDRGSAGRARRIAG